MPHNNRAPAKALGIILAASILTAPPAIAALVGLRDSAPLPEANAATMTLAQKRVQAINDAYSAFHYADVPEASRYVGTMTNCYDAATRTFNVNTASDFIWALYNLSKYANSTTQKTYMRINADIDCNGNAYNFTTWSSSAVNLEVEGNNHTIYNFHASRPSSAEKHGIFGNVTNNFTMRNLHFANCYLEAGSKVGIVGHTNNGITTLENTGMTDCYIQSINPGDPGGKTGFVGMPQTIDNPVNTIGARSTFKNVYAKNSAIIGDMHIGSVAGFYAYVDFTDCYSDNNTVISTGGHSGAFAGCTNEASNYLRCWSNSTIYGNSQVGGFTSGFDGLGSSYKDCFSSGVVEGEAEIGGFVGFANYYRWPGYPGATTFENCYSTCMVGMNYHASKAGGFIGLISATAMSASFKNCYAAGEVGSIDTDPTTATDCGGFAGVVEANANVSYDKCFYDIQNTAMKGKAVGSAALLSVTRSEDGSLVTSTFNGIQGLSTSAMTNGDVLFPANFEHSKGLYPQLTAMTNHDSVSFRAQSAASTATVFCDEWADISTAGYDTVRDTMRNFCFSSSEPFTSNPKFNKAHVPSSEVKDISWEVDGAYSPIDQTTRVVQLSQHPYYTTALAPGIEWATATVRYEDESGSATGTRRVRLIPTSLIETGGDKRVDVYHDDQGKETTPYDHKEGFATTYLDAKVLQSYLDAGSAPSGVLVTFEQVISQQYENGIISGTAQLPFNSAANGTTTLDVTAVMTDETGAVAHIDDLYEKLNGTKKFVQADCGMYKISYKAQLPDGRYLSVGKKLVVTGPWSVIYHYNYEGLLDDERILPDSIFYAQFNRIDFSDFTFENYDAPPARDGWEFSYWSRDREGNQPVTQEWFDGYVDRHGELDEHVEVWAQWKRSNPTLSLVADPTIGAYDDDAIGEKVTFLGSPDEKVVIAAAVAPYRYRFVSWIPIIAGGGKLSYDADTGLYVFTFGSEDASIKAKYDFITYTVKWIDDHTGEVVAEQSVVIDDSAAPPDLPSHSGYAFAGYDTNAWQEVKEDLVVRILYDWDTITMPETGSDGMYGMVLFAIVGTCVASYLGAAALMAFALKHK